MSIHVIAILVLVAAFVLATVYPINLGAIALVAAFVIGSVAVGGKPDDVADKIFEGFPGSLFVILVGVTFLFAIARANGTVDWLVQVAVRGVRGRIALIPWIMFAVTGLLSAFGAVVPAAVAIIAPVGLGFAVRHRINPVLMGLSIINGASAGGFSPLSIFGVITNGVVAKANLPGSPLALFLGSLVFNVLLNVVVFFLFGGRELLGRVVEQEPVGVAAGGGPGAARSQATGATGAGFTDGEHAPVTTLDLNRALTLVVLVALAVGALAFQLDVGLLAVTAVVLLSLLAPHTYKGAVAQVAWPTVLLICGIVTYVNLMQELGTIKFLGNQVALIGVPLLAALVICYIGGAVSAFASTTGILGALIPLAVPFLLAGHVGPVGLITALAISASVVDSSPFSTSGALVTASTPEESRDYVYRRLMRWGFSMVAVGPPITWLLLVVPGWL
ncbi:SLC13 family permease [Pseudonocardia acaciae]|uniref:SLC13 family permease n=1 Tax=Pseudonocardia acaciae TaxID=551276 RepID=UPI00048D78C0|nr:SLC13 family permease [Pseudonocardia acaciae]